MISRLRSIWRTWRHRAALDRDTRDELRFHIDSRVEDLVRRGMAANEDDARRQARLEFGNPAAWQEQCLDARRPRLFDEVIADMRFALRGFRQQKLLTAVVIATLTFGIGVSSGVFTVFSAIALRPMIDENVDADTFLRVYATSTTEKTRRNPFGSLTVEEYLAFRDGARTIRALSAQSRFNAPLGADAAEATSMSFVACNFFDVYGARRAVLGRLLQPSDCDDAAPVIVLTHTFWRTRFGGDERIVGRVLLVKGTSLTVIGVAPPMAAGVGLANAWIPYTLRRQLGFGQDPRQMTGGHYGHERWLNVTGRLAPGATREEAAAELTVLAARLDRMHPGAVSAACVTDGAIVHDPQSRGPALSIVSLVMGALTCLVLIACANVATLLLSRADARQQEVAVRLSLGAGRGRLLRMLLTETLTLAAIAGAGSVYVAYTLPRVLISWLVGTTPELSFSPDWRVFAYLAATVGVAGVAAGLAPALESLRVDILAALKGRRSTAGSTLGGSRFRAALVSVQVGLSFLLLVGAGLFVITHYRTVTREVGFESAQVLMPRVTLGTAAIASTSPRPDTIEETLRPLPDVRSIVFASVAPVFDSPKIEVATPDGPWLPVRANEVSPGFFDALDLPILRGRAIRDDDRPCRQDACVAVVSGTFAQQLLHTADPVGRTVHTKAGATIEIVGLAGDTTVRQFNVPDPPQMYLPWTPDGRPYQPLVRFTGGVAVVTPVVRSALVSRFPGAVVTINTLRAPIEGWVEDVGRVETLVVALGGTAAALAALGVFGIVSFAVSRRRQELGVRLALGAARHDIYSTVMGGAVRPVVIGLVCGIGLTLLTAVVFARVLFELHFAVSARDPLTYAAAGLFLVAIVTIALLLPARRAASINPLVALRYE